jgi:hypothetical protein
MSVTRIGWVFCSRIETDGLRYLKLAVNNTVASAEPPAPIRRQPSHSGRVSFARFPRCLKKTQGASAARPTPCSMSTIQVGSRRVRRGTLSSASVAQSEAPAATKNGPQFTPGTRRRIR